MALSNEEIKVETGETPFALTWSLVAGFLSWGVDHGAGYVIQQHACSVESAFALHVLTIVSVIVALSGFGLGLRVLHHLPEEKNEEGGKPHDRAHFQTLLGMGFSLGFSLIILAEAVPRWLLPVCT